MLKKTKHKAQKIQKVKNNTKNRPKNSYRTGSLASRASDDSKKSRVFGSLLRRHTSFGAPEGKMTAPPTISAPIMQSDNRD